LNRRLALKVMLPRFASDTAAKERFLREARAAAQISHDNVVIVYEADERDSIPFIAMQFLQGYPLDEYLRKKGVPSIPQILRIARETALGLAAAHRMGCVHRDIKPANLWLEAPHGRVKILDFGLARPVDTEVELTKSGAIVGTPAYMSPEQGRGLKVDHRTDLFSLGSVLYRLCTGKLPFEGPNTMAVLMALGIEEPKPVRELNSEVPESLVGLIHQLLAKRPNERPQTAEQVAGLVRGITEELATPMAQAVEAPSQAHPPVVYVPIEVSAQPQSNPFAELDEPETESTAKITDAGSKIVQQKKPGGNGMWIAAGFAILLSALAVWVVITTMKEKEKDKDGREIKDGAETKIAVPVSVPPTVKNDVSAALNRKAAQYVLSVGGSAYVNVGGLEIKATLDLPQDRFTLTRVILDGKKLTDEGLGVFKDCRNLMALSLDGVQITDVGMASFKNCNRLTHLNLSNSQFTETMLANFEDCKNLQALALNETRVGDQGLSYFKDCTNLTTLMLDNTLLTDEGLVNFKDCKNLCQLDLRNTHLTGAGLAYLKDCKNLKGLALDFVQVTDEGLANFKGCKALIGVGLRNTLVTDAGLEYFKDCENLSGLWLNETRVTEVGLVGFKNLTYLNVQGTKVSPKFIDEFSKAQPQCRIECNTGTIEPKTGSDTDRKAAEYVLSIGGTLFVNSVAKDTIVMWGLPLTRITLKEVNLQGNTTLNDDGLAVFEDCRNLTHLDLSRTHVMDKGLSHFKGCRNLTFLNFAEIPLTDEGLSYFKNCENLTTLQLANTKVGDAGLAHFRNCKNLMTLNLNGTRVTDEGLKHFKDCKNLVELNLQDTAVKDGGLVNFADCKKLTDIWIANTLLTDLGLANFKGCKNLKFIDLRKTKVTPKGIDEFSIALPKCKILHDGGLIEPN
jgi:Leucine-rich repeat (LRR) protein